MKKGRAKKLKPKVIPPEFDDDSKGRAVEALYDLVAPVKCDSPEQQAAFVALCENVVEAILTLIGDEIDFDNSMRSR